MKSFRGKWIHYLDFGLQGLVMPIFLLEDGHFIFLLSALIRGVDETLHKKNMKEHTFMKKVAKKWLAFILSFTMLLSSVNVFAEEIKDSQKMSGSEQLQAEGAIEDSQKDSGENESGCETFEEIDEVDTKEAADAEKSNGDAALENTEEETQENTPEDEKSEELSVAVSAEEAKDDALSEGTYSATSASENYSSFSMFKIPEMKIVISGTKATITAYTSSASYAYLYLGNKDTIGEGATLLTGESSNIKTGYTYAFTFEKNVSDLGNTIAIVPVKTADPLDYYDKKDVTLTLPAVSELTKESSGTDAGEGSTTTGGSSEGDDAKTPADLAAGMYYVSNVTTSSTMFKVTDCTIKQHFGSYNASTGTSSGATTTVTLTLSGVGYDYLYLGTGAVAAADESGWIPYKENAEGKYTYTYTVPSEEFYLDTPIAIAAHSSSKDQWYDRTVTLSSSETSASATSLSDGSYRTSVETNNLMFKVVDCELVSENGMVNATITLSGTGYAKLYQGTGEQAAADEGGWIANGTDDEGRYTFELKDVSLDTPINVAAYSTKNKIWYDRQIMFSSEDIKDLSASDNEDGDVDGEGDDSDGGSSGSSASDSSKKDTTKNDGKADSESKHEVDLNKSTGKVDSSTQVADGVYTPDAFTWSGGTGKVNITCSKITVKGGQAYATLAFSSTHYQYVKANGNTYYPTVSGGSSIFVIPVALNKNNKIVGMTTAMSQPHEITYSIFPYLAAASENGGSGSVGSSDSLDEEAPDILGLSVTGEVEVEHAKLFKIYEYEQDISLLEIDMRTANAGEYLEDADFEVLDEEAEDSETDVVVDESEEAGALTKEGEQTAEEYVADLYKENVVKYLIVPEGVEIPAGLDKAVIVINLPITSTYAATDEIVSSMDKAGALDTLKAIGYDAGEEDSDTPAIDVDTVTNIGAYDSIELRSLVAEKVKFGILPAGALPGIEDDQEELSKEEKEAAVAQFGTFFDIAESFALLSIPMIVDRSVDEESKEGQAEWSKVYEVLFANE